MWQPSQAAWRIGTQCDGPLRCCESVTVRTQWSCKRTGCAAPSVGLALSESGRHLWAKGVPLRAGSVVVPVERSEGGADYRAAFSGSNSRGTSFEADVPMTLAALLDHMEQRSQDVLSGAADRG